MRGIVEDLTANAEMKTDAVISALPGDFPDELVTSVSKAMQARTRLLARAIGE